MTFPDLMTANAHQLPESCIVDGEPVTTAKSMLVVRGEDA